MTTILANMQVSLDAADTLIDAALAEGQKRELLPLCVAVLDVGGHIIALKRQDGCGLLRADIAQGKAWAALAMGLNAATTGQRLSGNPGFLTAAIAASDGRMVPHSGGLLIIDADGRGIGAVGISGDTGENDELCARAGIAAAGLHVAPV
ncbi:GlcG/HbpS family heme-binding protein [Roseinatronobacter alkalisoli]|uniref:Heme-binding protein n=1 Tax=Roseinatronobacter alkalisoli TaxID=3028235 RepID=A0ABT5TAM8_9RHOB|nr:heme-binding protein [Roseinatronobacter sp. HJB301]MDD7972175.1 heme-binding protein [Roseinatronobacter sp. HJB301]